MADSQVAADLKQALEAGRFEEASSLAQTYGAGIVRQMRAAVSQEERAAIVQEASGFLQDRLSLAWVMRAHLSSQIDATLRLASYGNSNAQDNTWQLEG